MVFFVLVLIPVHIKILKTNRPGNISAKNGQVGNEGIVVHTEELRDLCCYQDI